MSFQQGISGLNAASRNLEVIGNNIANANTVGAKVARAEFADIYANAALTQLDTAPGMGVRVAAVTQQFGQGGIRATDNPMDAAVNGRGFFQVASPAAPGDAAYTRNGQFQLDNQGYVVTNGGMRLQGFGVDEASGRGTGVVGDVQLPVQGMAPKVTTEASLSLNLDGRERAPAAGYPAFATSDPDSYASATSMTVHDQQGNEHVLSTYFRRTATDNEWEVYTALDGGPVPAPAAGAPQAPSGRLTFRPDGTLDPAASGTLAGGTFTAGDLTLDVPFPASTLPVPPSTSVTSTPIRIDFADSTQFGSAFGITESTQDGNAPGQLTGFAIDGSGLVQARYSNGRTLAAAQVALADFRNQQGLAPVGGNLWRATVESGQALVGAPGSGNLGTLQGGALEESNIDLTQQLVDMITAQRAYQANAQTIKTQDQMMTTLVNLR